MPILTPISLVAGLILGSFLSVLISRLHSNEKGILMGRSQCPQCKEKLSALDLIPLFSFLVLKGKCRHCKKKIPNFYWILEISSACLLFGLTLVEPNWTTWLSLIPIAGVLLFIFFYDFLYQEVHDFVLIPGILYAAGWSFLFSDWKTAFLGAALGLAFFGIQYLASKGKWLGSGDILIGMFMGFVLGWELMIPALMISYILGSVIGLILIWKNKATKNTAIALGPFLVMGTGIAYLYGKPILNWILNG
jgi:prepilin signal peptidase PulO-like enzyme (type II secretory pathway)